MVRPRAARTCFETDKGGIVMKKIKELSVSTTYSVTLCNINVPDDVYKTLMSEDTFDTESCYREGSSEPIALEWLAEHINERDGTSWEYEVTNLEE